ncbi:MAG: hypothetical protein RJB38_1843 [Pseudomonadota bacterium]|jgi:trigger factor
MSNLQFQVEKVEKKSNILRQLTVRVPAQVVASHIEQGFRSAQKTAKIKGFRPGHVPLSLVKQFYGQDVRHQVFHDLIDSSFRQAVRGEKLQAIGRPHIETPEHQTGAGAHDHSLEEGKDLTYLATVEVMPEIQVKGYEGLALTRQSTKVEKADIDSVMTRYRESSAEVVPVTAEGAQAKKGNLVDVTFQGGLLIDGKVVAKAGMSGSQLIEIGSNTMIPGFEDELVGLSKGETKTFEISFPKDYSEADFAGQRASFTVSVTEIKEKHLPELNDEFAKQMGYDSLVAMTQDLEARVQDNKKQESTQRLRSDLLQTLIEKNTFEVPSTLVQAQIRYIMEDLAQNLRRQGAKDEMINQILTAQLEAISKKAENQVRASLIIQAVAEAEKVVVSEEDFDAEVSKMAISMRIDEARVREFYFGDESRKEELRNRIREDKTVNWLLDQAKIKDAK